MARAETVDLCERLNALLGADIPDSKRLCKLDSTIWRLEELKFSDPTLEITYPKKSRVFGFSRRLSEEMSIDLDKNVLDKIIKWYEEEYQKQAMICNDLIRKLR